MKPPTPPNNNPTLNNINIGIFTVNMAARHTNYFYCMLHIKGSRVDVSSTPTHTDTHRHSNKDRYGKY